MRSLQKLNPFQKWTHGNTLIEKMGESLGCQCKLKTLCFSSGNGITQNPEVQQYLLKSLKMQLLMSGGMDFVYDAAKHIELPGEYPSEKNW